MKLTTTDVSNFILKSICYKLTEGQTLVTFLFIILAKSKLVKNIFQSCK